VFTPFADQTLIVSDPRKPILNEFADRSGAHDYRALAARRDVVTLETAPMRSDLTVIGGMRAELTISADVPDVDIWVKVFDVAPDGTAYNLMSPGLDVIRASYRNQKPQRELLQQGHRYRIKLGELFTANTFKQGHKIRVLVLPSFFPDFSRNLHTGTLESGSDQSRVAHITVFHDDLQKFRLILPVVPASAMLSASK
jgi:putative CocE/NonD family hydrolase